MSINVGILGFAHGHVNAYCNVWRDRPELGVSVSAAWDHNADRLKQMAETYGLRPYDDVSTLLDDAGVQAVVVASETSMHADLVEKAAAAGKSIVVQKPLALTMKQADGIVDAVNRSGVPFTVAWQMRTDPQNIKIKELIGSGILGKVFMVRRRHGLSVHRWAGFEELWHNKPEFNRDIWADDSAHPIDFIQWLLGVPETLTAELATLNSPRVPNDNGIAIFRYPGGPLAEVVCSFTCTAAENTTEVIAERGTIIQNYGDVPGCAVPPAERSAGLKWFLADEGRWTHSDIASPAGHGERIAGLVEPLAEFLHGRRPPIATVEEGRTSLRMVLATYVSSREGRRVRIDEESVYEI